jgi:hypothetical protein
MQIDLWEKVAECEHLLRSATDPRQRELSLYLRGLWLSLVDESRFLTDDQLANEIEAAIQIEKDFQADLDGLIARSLH